MAVKDEQKVIAVINAYFKVMNLTSTNEANKFCVYDAEDDNCILEIKVRKRDYGDTAVEVKKVEALIEVAKAKKKIPYLCVVNDSGYHIVDVRTKYKTKYFPVFRTTDFHREGDKREMQPFAVWYFDTLTINSPVVRSLERRLGL